MKKIITILCCLIALSHYIQAQSCGGLNSATSHTATGMPGLTPSFYTLSCLDSGVYVSDTLYFENYTSVYDSGTSFTVTSLKIDSIENLPPGLCWTTNVTGNQFTAGQTGAIVISGAPQGMIGQFKLRIVVDVSATGTGGTLNLFTRDAESLNALISPPLRYYLRVREPGASCPAVDTTQGIYVLTSASISASSHIICTSSAVTLTANSCTGCTYAWSNGANTLSTQVTTPGSYGLTVTQGSTVATATPVTITQDNPLISAFTLSQSSSQSNLWNTSNTSTGTGITYYQWSWGDGSGYGDSTYSPSHLYTTAGVFTVCLYVADSLGCSATHCDSTSLVAIPLPTSPSISSNGIPVVCNGGPVTLTTNFCTGCTYLWSQGSTTQSINVTTAGPFSVTISDGVNSVSATSGTLRLDTINVSFTMTQDPSVSNLYHVTNTSTGAGLTYGYWSWGDGSYGIDTLNGDSHTYTNPGAFTICLTQNDSVGCQITKCDSSGVVTIPLPSTATITPSNPVICNSYPVTLTASFCSACTYLWSTGSTSQSIGTSTAGTYTVTISAGGSSVISAPFTIGADNISASFSLVQDTQILHHWFVVNNCTGTGPLYYQWSWGDGSYGDSTANPVHTYSAAGNYNICVYVGDNAGCSAQYCDSSTYISRSQAIISVTVIPGTSTGITDITANAAKVYPNPTTGMLTIETTQPGASSALIYDALGRALTEVNITSNKTNLDLSNLSNGVYTMSFRDGSPSVRFVITR